MKEAFEKMKAELEKHILSGNTVRFHNSEADWFYEISAKSEDGFILVTASGHAGEEYGLRPSFEDLTPRDILLLCASAI